MAFVVTALLVAGCTGRRDSGMPIELVIGRLGHSSGLFYRPRGIAHSAGEECVYVLDWSGRMQKFTTGGVFRASWRMPDIEKGKPEDTCMSPTGSVMVTDTHYSRILEFTNEGQFLRSFGSYGREPGQFIYPVGICTGRDGFLYVSEYGENDRIQKFTFDGQPVAAWGRFGDAPGEFQRPSGIDVSPDDQLLYVADAVNHRIQVFDSDGALKQIIGKEGTAPGCFRYPYDVAVAKDALYVLEYGNQRLQKLTRDGVPVSFCGSPGEFATPWRCALVHENVYVSDTDNHRVLRLGVNW